MESNKIFAAILIAGILAMLSGFVAKKIIHVEAPHEDAFKIEGLADAGAAGGAAAATGPEPILALLASADASKGESFAKACAACHTFGKGENFKVGPNLYGVVNNHHAHMEGFAYSDAMTALKDKRWDYAALNEFLFNPKKAVNGTKMVFAGIKKPQDRANVIAYLRSLADSPVALPSDSDIKAEAAAAAPAEGDKKADAKTEDAKAAAH